MLRVDISSVSKDSRDVNNNNEELFAFGANPIEPQGNISDIKMEGRGSISHITLPLEIPTSFMPQIYPRRHQPKFSGQHVTQVVSNRRKSIELLNRPSYRKVNLTQAAKSPQNARYTTMKSGSKLIGSASVGTMHLLKKSVSLWWSLQNQILKLDLTSFDR